MANTKVRRMYEFEQLGLGNISPALNAQVEHYLEQLADAFQDESPLLDGFNREGEFTLKVKFRHNLEKRSTQIETKFTGKLPGYRGVESTATLNHGTRRFLVEEDDEQAPLFTQARKADDEGGEH